MLRRGARSAFACLLVALAPAPARADADVSAITAALEGSDYPGAQELVTKALAAGGNAPDTTAELYRLQGVIEGSLGNANAATEAFQKALALNPKLSLAAGMSPKIVKPFEAARAATTTKLEVKVETSGSPPSVTLIVHGDPMKMVARARVAVVVDGQPEQMLDGIGTIALPLGARLDVRVAVLDVHGNRLVEIGSSEVPIVVLASGAPPRPPPRGVDRPPTTRVVAHERPLYLQWWLWGGAALAFAGTGSGFGLAALSAKNDLEDLNAHSAGHTFDEARAVEDTIRTRLLVTNISYGVAIGCGVTAAILLLTRPRAAERSAVTLTPAPVRGGGAVVLGGEF